MQYAHLPDHSKEVLKFIADALNIVKNQNFEVCSKVFSKILPAAI